MNETQPQALLVISGLTRRFGGLVACRDVDLTVYQNEILGLIGPNGAGKSTILSMIAGTLRPTKGKLVFKDENITRFPADRRSMKGIGRVFQGNVLFRNLTVQKNVLLGMHDRTRRGFWGSLVGSRYSRGLEKTMEAKASEVLELVGLADKADEVALNLPHGKQRLLCLAVALAGGPELLLLDEPVTGMNAEEVSEMLSVIRMLKREKGITSIVVEHNMRAVMSLCDRIAVISYGEKIAEGTPEEISQDLAVIEAYLGADQDVA
jgi:branched-chain amino acid transport system ATP-binding protein